ncbi:hypothetical protein PIB30_009230 [Stylosanthes scabra]|uniref:Uncharacterized protein n=1 Tax=Stylosanthes scabra TaxID=79078 RepID=A0ABU6Q516_9FABA|nr:hypothetical protein [Stylosanthes scabra]
MRHERNNIGIAKACIRKGLRIAWAKCINKKRLCIKWLKSGSWTNYDHVGRGRIFCSNEGSDRAATTTPFRCDGVIKPKEIPNSITLFSKEALRLFFSHFKVDDAIRMHIAIDLVLKSYNLKKNTIIKAAKKNYRKIEEKNKNLVKK